MNHLCAIFIILGVLQTCFGIQAQRDEADETDSLNISPLRGLHFIDITTEEDVFLQKGIKKKSKAYQYYFRVEGEKEYTKVSYFGINLAQYLLPVEESHRIMKSYQYMKMMGAATRYGGVAMTLVSGTLSIVNKELNPLLLVGVAILAISYLPSYFTHDKIPEAVGVYNSQVGNYQEKIEEEE
jgi:hypothetical protein